MATGIPRIERRAKGNSMFSLHSPLVILESPEVRPMWLQGRDLRKLERIMAEGAGEARNRWQLKSLFAPMTLFCIDCTADERANSSTQYAHIKGKSS